MTTLVAIKPTNRFLSAMNLAKKHAFSLLIGFCTLFYANLASAQAGGALPNAYVDIAKTLQAMPGYQDSIKKLDAIRALYQNQYNYLLVDLQQKIKTYESKKDSLSPYVANLKLAEIKQAQANLDTFQMVANNALQMQQNQVIGSFMIVIREVSKSIGVKRKLGTIWDSAMLKNAIWTDPNSDITQEVIDAILAKSKTPTAPVSGKKKP